MASRWFRLGVAAGALGLVVCARGGAGPERDSQAPAAERAVLDRAFSDAMVALARRHPDDLDAATLAAESIMDLSPWS